MAASIMTVSAAFATRNGDSDTDSMMSDSGRAESVATHTVRASRNPRASEMERQQSDVTSERSPRVIAKGQSAGALKASTRSNNSRPPNTIFPRRAPSNPLTRRLQTTLNSTPQRSPMGSAAASEQQDLDSTPSHIMEEQIALLSLKQKIHALFEAEGFGETLFAEKYWVLATGTFVLTLVLIITSVMVFTVESLPQYYSRDLPAFLIIEAVCIAWFTLEMATRFVTSSNKKRFLKDVLNWVDMVAVLPFYIDIMVQAWVGSGTGRGFIVLRVVRLARMFRVFKLSKYSEGIQVVGIALRRSSDALSLLLFLTTITVVIFGSAVFFAEQSAATFDPINQTWVRDSQYGGANRQHDFKSIPHSFWWCLVTITTVGYGDMIPVTLPGYLVGAAAMFTGILIAAFPIIILGANFSDAREAQLRKKEIERLSRLDHLEMAEASSPRGRRNKESVLQMMEAAAVDNDLEGGGDLFTADTNHRRRSVLSDSTAPRFGFGTNIQQRKQSADKLANLDNRDFLILILARVEALDCSLNDLREDVMCLREEKQEYPDPFSDVARTSFFQ